MPLSESERRIADYYDNEIFDAERVRLTENFPVELAMTRRLLERWAPEGARVAEIGVGGGQYTEALLRRNCSVHLVDISQKLMGAVLWRMRDLGLQKQIVGLTRESATNLETMVSDTCDVVLLLGPLYHLATREERRQAVAEAHRILKRDGVLFAAGINHLGYFREVFRERPHVILSRRAFHEQFLKDGIITPAQSPLGWAHLTTPQEFRALFGGEFEQLAFLGLESFAAPYQKQWNELDPAEAEAWLDLIERTGATEAGMAHSDHFLFVASARK